MQSPGEVRYALLLMLMYGMHEVSPVCSIYFVVPCVDDAVFEIDEMRKKRKEKGRNKN